MINVAQDLRWILYSHCCPYIIFREVILEKLDIVFTLVPIVATTTAASTPVTGIEWGWRLRDYSAGVDENGKFKGQLKATGVRPKFAQKLADHGIRLGPEMFSVGGGPQQTRQRNPR